MVSKVDQQRVCALLTEAVTVICKNGLTYNSKFCIEGLLGITLDDRDIFLVNIKETIQNINGNTNQRKSESDSKVGGQQQKYLPQNGGGRGMPQMAYGSQMSMRGRGGRGMPQSSALTPDRRRKMANQGMSGVPAKRMMTGPGGPQPYIMRPSGPVGPQDKIPQEWAALIQLQQSQHQRGRGAPSARRRAQMRFPGPGGRGSPGGQLSPGSKTGTPSRRWSQGSGPSPTETAEATKEKHAELARQRAERLERRKAMATGEPFDPIKIKIESSDEDKTPTKKDTSDQGNKSADDNVSEKETKEVISSEEPPGDTSQVNTDAEKPDDSAAPKEEDHKDKTEHTPDNDKEDQGKDMAPSTGTSNVPRRREQGGPGREEGGTASNPDGTWLLSNSSWLLGDLEAMSEDSSWKMQPHRQAEGGGRGGGGGDEEGSQEGSQDEGMHS